MNPETQLVHPLGVDDPFAASSPPIYQTATFAQAEPGI